MQELYSNKKYSKSAHVLVLEYIVLERAPE